MSIRQIFKISRKTFFNPRDWVDWDYIKTENLNLYGTLRSQYSIPTAEQPETFDEAIERLQLTPADLQQIQIKYRLIALFFLVCGFLTFIYTFYILFSHGILSGWFLGLAVTALALSQAFRFDFWAWQIKKRKLGMTYAEWRKIYLGENKGKTA